MTLKKPLFRSLPLLLFAFALIFAADSFAQRGRANVLYSDRPLPIRIGVEIGTTWTNFLSATPTLFPVKYPYSDGPDTTHFRFADGFAPLFGTHLGIAVDFSITDSWSLLTKLNYNERRGNWNNTTQIPFDNGSAIENIPLTNDYTLMLRYLTLEILPKYSFESAGGLYLSGGPAFNYMLSNHYDIRQTLGGPDDVSFVDFGSGQATGIKDYRVGYEYDNEELSSFLLELKALVGYPIPIGYRWTLNPEITVAFPITQVFSSKAKDTYKLNGVNSTPNPLTLAGILALRYEL